MSPRTEPEWQHGSMEATARLRSGRGPLTPDGSHQTSKGSAQDPVSTSQASGLPSQTQTRDR